MGFTKGDKTPFMGAKKHHFWGKKNFKLRKNLGSKSGENPGREIREFCQTKPNQKCQIKQSPLKPLNFKNPGWEKCPVTRGPQKGRL